MRARLNLQILALAAWVCTACSATEPPPPPSPDPVEETPRGSSADVAPAIVPPAVADTVSAPLPAMAPPPVPPPEPWPTFLLDDPGRDAMPTVVSALRREPGQRRAREVRVDSDGDVVSHAHAHTPIVLGVTPRALDLTTNGVVVARLDGELAYLDEGGLAARGPDLPPALVHAGQRTVIEPSPPHIVVRRGGEATTLEKQPMPRAATVSRNGALIAMIAPDGAVTVASLTDPTRRNTWPASTHGDERTALALTSAGRAYVLRPGANQIAALDLATGERLPDLSFDRELRTVSVVDDDRLILSDAQGHVHLVELDGAGRPTRGRLVAPGHGAPLDDLEAEGSVDRVVTCDRDGLRVWRISDGALLGEHDGPCHELAVDTVKLTAWANRDDRVYAVDLVTGRAGHSLVEVAASAERVVAVTVDGVVLAWPRESPDARYRSTVTTTFTDVLAAGDRVALEPDARHVVFARGDAPLQRIDTRTGEPHPTPLAQAADAVTALGVSSNGLWLAAAHARGLGVWSLADGQRAHHVDLQTTVLDFGPAVDIAVSDNGARVVACDAEGRLLVAPGLELLGQADARCEHVVVSPDGAHVAWLDSRGHVVIAPIPGEAMVLAVPDVAAFAWVGSGHLAVQSEDVSIFSVDAEAPRWVREDASLVGQLDGHHDEVVVRVDDRLELITVADRLERARLALPDALEDADTLAIHGEVFVSRSPTGLRLWTPESIARISAVLEGGASLFRDPSPRVATAPLAVRSDPVALRTALGLEPDHEAHGRVVDASRGLGLELGSQPGKVLVDLDALAGGAGCREDDWQPEHALLFDGAGTSVALVFAPMAVDLWVYDPDARCIRETPVFVAPDGELIFEASQRVSYDDRAGWQVPEVQRIGLEVSSDDDGLETLVVGEHGVAIMAGEDELFSLTDDSGEGIHRDREDYERAPHPYEPLPWLTMALRRSADGTLLVEVDFNADNHGPHGDGTESHYALVQLTPDDLYGEPLEEASSESSSGWTFVSESSWSDSEVTRQLVGPDGAWIEYHVTESSRSETNVCPSGFDDDDDDDEEPCCETTTRSRSSSGGWTHDELGTLVELPDIDEETNDGACD